MERKQDDTMLKVRINDTDLKQDVRIRIASRALILNDSKIAILFSKKFQAYITPGGGVEGNETLEEACIREAKEETGFIVEPIEQIALIDCNYSNVRIKHNYFICELIEDSNNTDRTSYEIDQDLELKWLSLSDVKQAYASICGNDKYDIWMQREFLAISELRKYLKQRIL